VPHFQNICYLSLCQDFTLSSSDGTATMYLIKSLHSLHTRCNAYITMTLFYNYSHQMQFVAWLCFGLLWFCNGLSFMPHRAVIPLSLFLLEFHSVFSSKLNIVVTPLSPSQLDLANAISSHQI
jgi:hypothetical protein